MVPANHSTKPRYQAFEWLRDLFFAVLILDFLSPCELPTHFFSFPFLSFRAPYTAQQNPCSLTRSLYLLMGQEKIIFLQGTEWLRNLPVASTVFPLPLSLPWDQVLGLPSGADFLPALRRHHLPPPPELLCRRPSIFRLQGTSWCLTLSGHISNVRFVWKVVHEWGGRQGLCKALEWAERPFLPLARRSRGIQKQNH